MIRRQCVTGLSVDFEKWHARSRSKNVTLLILIGTYFFVRYARSNYRCHRTRRRTQRQREGELPRFRLFDLMTVEKKLLLRTNHS